MQTRDRSLFTSVTRETTGSSSASREQQPELNIAQRAAAFGANEAVRIAALNVLSAARQKLGSLDKVTRVVRLCVYLATHGDFFDQPKVADAASELFRDVFGEDKTSVRMVLGVASLPLGMPVAVEVILEVEA
jgi:enamine deaminase RidA (YjgF/YER057c/UK114 family)